MKKYFLNFLKYRNLFKELTMKEIKLKYRRSYLGVLWSLLNPLLSMIVLTIVFSTLFSRNINNFPVYLLTGKLIFDFNSQATRGAMGSIISNSQLLKKIYIPKYVFPISKVLATFVTLGFSLIALFLVMFVTKAPFYPTLLLIWMPLLYLFIFSTGLGLILSAVAVFFRDMTHLYDIILTAWTYFTPIFYPAEIIPDKYSFLLKTNPLYYIVTMFRDIILNGNLPSLQSHFICLAFSSFVLIAGMIIFKKCQDRFILYI